MVVSVTGIDIFPVAALARYLASRESCPSPFFIDAKGVPVTKPGFVQQFLLILQSLGIPAEQYTGHSFWLLQCVWTTKVKLDAASTVLVQQRGTKH